MTTKRQQFLVGLFMAAGLTIAIAALIWLGMSRYFEEGRLYAAYFDQSVQGLTVDAPVKYRGVTVGRVVRIAVAPDARLIMVVMLIDTGMDLAEDIVAQLKVVGITGSMFIELDRAEPAVLAASPRLSFPSPYPVISSRPSDISELFRGLDEIIRKIGSLDLPGLVARGNRLLDHLDQAVTAADPAGAARQLRTTLERLNQALDPTRIDRILARLETDLETLGAAADAARTTMAHGSAAAGEVRAMVAENRETVAALLVNLRDTLATADRLLRRTDTLAQATGGQVQQVGYQLAVTLESLGRAVVRLEQLIEDLDAAPSQLLFSAPPPPRVPQQGDLP